MHKKTANLLSKIFPGSEEPPCLPPEPQGDTVPFELEALQAVIAVFGESPNPSAAAGEALHRAVGLLGLQAGAILLPAANALPAVLNQAGLPAEKSALLTACRQAADQAFRQKRATLAVPEGQAMLVAVLFPHCEHPLGAVVFATQPEAFSERSLPLLHLTGQAIGVAVGQAQLKEKIESEAALRLQAEKALQQARESIAPLQRELALYDSLLNAVASAPTAADLLAATCQALVSCLQATQSAAALLDDSGKLLTVVAEFVPPGRTPALGMVIPVQDNPASLYVIRQKAPLALCDAQHDILLAPVHEIMEARGVASLLIVPILDRGQVIGTLGIDSAEMREFSPREIELALQAAGVAARALEYTRRVNPKGQESTG